MKNKTKLSYYVQNVTATSGFILFLLILSRIWWEKEHGKPGLADILFPHADIINNMLAVTGIITAILVFTCILLQHEKKFQR